MHSWQPAACGTPRLKATISKQASIVLTGTVCSSSVELGLPQCRDRCPDTGKCVHTCLRLPYLGKGGPGRLLCSPQLWEGATRGAAAPGSQAASGQSAGCISSNLGSLWHSWGQCPVPSVSLLTLPSSQHPGELTRPQLKSVSEFPRKTGLSI